MNTQYGLSARGNGFFGLGEAVHADCSLCSGAVADWLSGFVLGAWANEGKHSARPKSKVVIRFTGDSGGFELLDPLSGRRACFQQQQHETFSHWLAKPAQAPMSIWNEETAGLGAGRSSTSGAVSELTVSGGII